MSTRSQAERLGVAGTVRNLSNGDVEIVAAGETEAVDALLEWAKSGSPSAVVKNLQTEAMDYKDGEFSSFEIRR